VAAGECADRRGRGVLEERKVVRKRGREEDRSLKHVTDHREILPS